MSARLVLRTVASLGSVAALVLAAVLIHVVTAQHSAALTVRAQGALAWPFQGDAAVASAHEADADAAFARATWAWVLRSRAQGHPLAQVGRPHPVFAVHYTPRSLDVLVVVAPVSGAGQVAGVAALYGSDSGHHGFDAVVPFAGFDQQVSGNVRSYVHDILDLVTVVVGGPRAGGLLVNADGVRQNVGDLSGFQISFDRRGITWLYGSVPATIARPRDGVITLTDGNGNLSNVLYYGRPGAGGVLG